MEIIKLYHKKTKSLPFRSIVYKAIRKVYRMIYYRVRAIRVKLYPLDKKSSIFQEFSSNMVFFFMNRESDYYVKKLHVWGQNAEIIKKADKICDHSFDLLGSGEINLGKEIQWNQDFKSGFIWKNEFYKKIEIIDISNNADVIVVWELSRFQHIPILGQAYWLSNDKKYLQEFQDQIEDWISKNPVEMSVNWTMAMDVAIRACNWITGIYFFKNCGLNEVFLTNLNKSLYMHGEFIIKNLSNPPKSNNHYISNLVGLIWLGIYFRNLKYKKNKAELWLNFAISELEKEMLKQVYDDGCDWEAATYYHCLVTEFILYTAVLCKYNNILFSDIFYQRLEKMCEFIMNITKPNGNIPLIGDIDNGRFIMLTGYGDDEMRDFRYLLGVGAEFFNREDFRRYAGNQMAALWILKNFKKPSGAKCNQSSKAFLQGGYFLLCNNRVYLIIRCGKNGTGGSGTHTHNDQLAFELNIDGEDFIIDPGMYAYTSDYPMRNLFRSTRYHNTVWIENIEQNDFDPNSKGFRMEDQTNARMISSEDSYFAGRHHGYEKKCGIIHERHISLSDELIVIKDKLLSKPIITKKNNKNFMAHANLILDDDVRAEKSDSGVHLMKKGVELFVEFDTEYRIEDTYISRKYGDLRRSKKIMRDLSIGISFTKIHLK